MAQYKHDRYFKSFSECLYESKGQPIQNISIRNDEDLEIDFMFIGDSEKVGWKTEKLGLFDQLMQIETTIILEHYSGYLEKKDIHKCTTRKNLYWEPKEEELIENARIELSLKKSQRLPKEALKQIGDREPFTWILTVNCSKNLLELCGAESDLAFGNGVYRLSPLLRMGIVVIEQLNYSPETVWLKMLGGQETVRQAFDDIKQLSSQRRERNDIIKTTLKYCAYLRQQPTEDLTEQELNFMKTMDEIYQAEMNKYTEQGLEKGLLQGLERGLERGLLQGKIESVNNIIIAKFGIDTITLKVKNKLTELNTQQLDQLMIKIINLKDLQEMEDCLENIITNTNH